MRKLRAGVLAATGAVGQNYVHLLRDHPWFEITFLAASKDSKSFEEAVSARGWFMGQDIPADVRKLRVFEASNLEAALDGCDFVFSALDKDVAKDLEMKYAKAGLPVVSNASAYRGDPFVPMLMPEINADHIRVIPAQQRRYGFKDGFIVVKPNCSLQSYMKPIHALMAAGYNVDRLIVHTQQAASGAGRPGVSALDLIDNVVPFISGEEEKSEREPLKILGSVDNDKGIVDYEGLAISATCTRVPVRDGHLASVNISFRGKKPSADQIRLAWALYRREPQELGLLFAPDQPIIYRDEPNRPQPVLDRDSGNGMAVTAGRLRECPVFDYKFVCLSHNTVRGAAGGGILNAELLYAKDCLKPR
ncbi:aspartate-semialdehyde dehydrogenase [Candidatus Woesearchaeota archaeon]|nr:aspartate-semialdehyde dehydrogenase [Candidatus Woesearchaeota archaeon]